MSSVAYDENVVMIEGRYLCGHMWTHTMPFETNELLIRARASHYGQTICPACQHISTDKKGETTDAS